MKIHDDSVLEGGRDSSQGMKVTLNSSNQVSRSESSSISTNSMMVDLELGGDHQEEQSSSKFQQGDYFEDDSGSRVAHKTVFSRRRLRAACVGCTLLVVLIIFSDLAFRNAPDSNISPQSCDDSLSPPYASNRTVSTVMCTKHADSSWVNPDLMTALFPPEKKGKNSIPFLVFGDFGRDGLCCQRDVAVEMDRAATALDTTTVINTGDAFYAGGIMTSSDEQIKTSFLNVYNQPKLKESTFYSILGNHEYRGSATAVLQLHGKHKRFVMDSRYYWRTFSNNNLNVQFIFLDTSPMIESYKISGYDSPDDIMLKRLDGISSQWSLIETQTLWMENLLAQPGYDMRIVVGHHPVYGLSAHKGETRTYLQTRIAPLLEKYNVTAYLAGHDHNLQFSQVGRTAHFISGAGSKTAPAFEASDTPKGAVQFYYNEHGFLACNAYKDQLRVAVVDMAGQVLDQVVLESKTPKASS